MSPLFRTIGIATAIIVCGSVTANAQGTRKLSELIVTVKTLDDEIFNKYNETTLCKKEGEKRYVDKQQLAILFLKYRNNDLTLVFDAWFIGSNNKLYTPVGPAASLNQFLDPLNTHLRIECSEEKKPKSEPANFKEQFDKTIKNVVVRKGVADLTVPSDQLTKANAALVSYTKDTIAETRSFSTEGLIGYVFAGTAADEEAGTEKRKGELLPRPLLWYSVTPYLYMKRFDQEPNSKAKKDAYYYMPGVAANWTWENGIVGFVAQVDVSTTLDVEQSSQQESATFRFAPRLNLWEGLPSPGYLWVVKPLPFGLRPDLSLVAREFHISDAGTNPELLSTSSYLSLGFDATATFIWLDPASIFSSFVVKTGYTYRDNGGVADVRRKTANVSFAPFFSKNITVELEYVNGRDENTLKQEERWTAGLGIRF